MFSSLGNRVIGAAVLDLFAGSGSLGIEALSRGADSCVFVESSTTAAPIIEENLKKAQLRNGTVQRRDIRSFLSAGSRPAQFDLIFADPPYARDEATLAQLTQLLTSSLCAAALKPSGILVLETFASVPIPETPLWKVAKEKIYGNTRVSYLSASE